MKQVNDSAKIRINTIVVGEPAKWLVDWKKRGLVISYTDVLIQAFRLFNEKITEQDLTSTQLQNIKKVESDF